MLTTYAAWSGVMLATLALAAAAFAGDAKLQSLETIQRLATSLLIFAVAFGLGLFLR